MNLGGIKISSAEIEHTVRTVPDVTDAAAIAVASEQGPSRLVIYTVCSGTRASQKDVLAAAMQKALRRELNPLFKIHDIVIIPALPRTASNKVLRRVLRDRYNQESRLKKQESMLR
jgi:acetyl-CoA synthetase